MAELAEAWSKVCASVLERRVLLRCCTLSSALLDFYTALLSQMPVACSCDLWGLVHVDFLRVQTPLGMMWGLKCLMTSLRGQCDVFPDTAEHAGCSGVQDVVS